MTYVSLILSWLLLTLGVTLLAVGWWGRRRGDHCHCRSCSFDLSGLPETANTCPECGTVLSGAKAKVRGLRVRRRGLVVIGTVLLLLGGVQAGHRLMGIDYYHLAPDFVLVALLDELEARQETIVRLGAQKFTDALAIRSVDKALEVQGDPSLPWHDTWGEIVALVGARGLLSPAQTLRYAEQAGTLKLQVRPSVQLRRQPYGYVGGDPTKRIGPNSQIVVRVGAGELVGDGQTVEIKWKWLRNRTAEISWKPNGGPASWAHLPLGQVSARLGSVPVELEIEPEFTVTTGMWTTTAMKGAVRKLTARVEVVDHLTGNYVEPGARPVADRATNAWVWIRMQGGVRRLVFGAIQPERMQHAKMWMRVDGRIVDVKNWVKQSSWREHPDGSLYTR